MVAGVTQVEYNGYRCTNYALDNGLRCTVVHDETYPLRVATALNKKMLEAFEQRHKPVVWASCSKDLQCETPEIRTAIEKW